MNKLRFVLLGSLFMTAACSSIGPIFESGDQMKVNSNAAASRNESMKLKRGNQALNEKLGSANKHIAELEMIAAKLAQQLEIKTAELRELNNRPMPTVQALRVQDVAQAASADVDVYHLGVDQHIQQIAKDAMQQKGFMPHYPALPDTMGMASSTTVFYYDDSFVSVAANLVKQLAGVLNSEVKIMKGVSPYKRNKLIVHMIGGGQ